MLGSKGVGVAILGHDNFVSGIVLLWSGIIDISLFVDTGRHGAYIIIEHPHGMRDPGKGIPVSG